ncbi:hypothetical protein [Burkholderia territorii]|nr:hypothetical protein [Burkholderia territorii]
MTGYPTDDGATDEKSDIGVAPMDGNVLAVAEVDVAMERAH